MFPIVATKMIVGILLLENVWWSPIFTLTFLKPERVLVKWVVGPEKPRKIWEIRRA